MLNNKILFNKERFSKLECLKENIVATKTLEYREMHALQYERKMGMLALSMGD